MVFNMIPFTYVKFKLLPRFPDRKLHGGDAAVSSCQTWPLMLRYVRNTIIAIALFFIMGYIYYVYQNYGNHNSMIIDRPSSVKQSNWDWVFSTQSAYQTNLKVPHMFGNPEERLVYSKLFQYALQPTSVIPFFYRSTRSVSQQDITITTLITIERLEVFSKLVDKFKGIQ